MSGALVDTTEGYQLHYRRKLLPLVKYFDTLENAIAAAYGMRELGDGVPCSLLSPDGAMILDEAGLNEAMDRLGGEAKADTPTRPRTWGEFKAFIEAAGIIDTDVIAYIDFVGSPDSAMRYEAGKGWRFSVE